LGEIKSTLELVLEKTKGLTLSEDEKLSLKHEELDKKIQGLVAHYLDNFFTLPRVREEMENIEGDDRQPASRALVRHLLVHFDLDHDNSAVMSALREVCYCDVAPFAALQREYLGEKEEHKRTFFAGAMAALEERGVSGSAVAPNPNRIPEWGAFLENLRKRYQEKLASLARDCENEAQRPHTQKR